MSLHNIDDYGLSADQLSEKYERHDAHPNYLVADWQLEVMDGDTRRSYWDWVTGKLADEQDELDRDNPYCQHMSLGDD